MNFVRLNRPEWEHNYNFNMCLNCVIKMGKHEYSTLIENCPICFEDKKMLILQCSHKLCNECWYQITDIGYINIKGDYQPNCPICRNRNDWNI